MKAIPRSLDTYDCYAAPLSSRSIKAACAAALKVRVHNGMVKMMPIEQGSFKYAASWLTDSKEATFNCKDINASGLLYPGSTTSASVMLYDDYAGPLSNLSVTGPNQISLALSGTPDPFDDSCTLHYTVVQGCVFGVRAPAKPAAACPAGFYRKTGRSSTNFCAPCGPGTYSSAPGAPCKPCPVGTESVLIGATSCGKCEPGYYAPRPGSSACTRCDATSEDKWTDGVRCEACPKASYGVPFRPGPSCFKCVAGRRCCTVGWGAACPKCAEGGTSSSILTSTFALETATPPSCLATTNALCSPKINITLDDACQVSINNLGNDNTAGDGGDCAWFSTVGVQGHGFSVADIAQFSGLAGIAGTTVRVESAAAPYLSLHIPATGCTLRYRALTSPVASLLGAAPKPGNAGTSCAAGQYLETATDAPPGPCLPCPPGTYAPIPSSGHPCTLCPAGTFTDRYGSTSCKQCPAGMATEKPGAGWCGFCHEGSYPAADGKSCVTCPKDSDVYYSGPSRACLRNQLGTLCCAAGDCKGQTPCRGRLPSLDADETESYTAVIQLVSKSPPLPACESAALLSCLPLNSQLLLTSSGSLALDVGQYRTNNSCFDAGSYTGGYTSTTGAYVLGFDPTGTPAAYALTTASGLFPGDSAAGTLAMYFTDADADTVTPDVPSAAERKCFAVFKLVSGYAFDLSPPEGASCDPADAVNTYGGRQFCQPCSVGQYRDGGGVCSNCPPGYYNDQHGATTCKPCPAGYSCDVAASTSPEPCTGGTYSSQPKQSSCTECPANTFVPGSLAAKPTTACTPCPKGTIAPRGATSCGIPWEAAPRAHSVGASVLGRREPGVIVAAT